ncbi:MAG: apolipoprotein N-acyltransferase [Acidobacteriota bacterium]|nr:apolipoprotein N-acyltransferase [Acidobacteriota bacterium]
MHRYLSKDGWLAALVAGSVSGLLLNLANEPFGIGLLGLVAVIPLLGQFENGWRRRLLAGWLAGFLLQAFGYHWIFQTIRDFGGQSNTVSALGTVAFQLYQGLDVAVWLLLAPLLCRHLPKPGRPFAAAATWLLVQDHLFPYTFPWDYGNIFAGASPLGEAAAFWGATGLGFLALSIQGVAVWYPRKPAVLTCAALLVAMASGIAARSTGAVETWRVGVIQPNLIARAKSALYSTDFFNAHFEASKAFRDRQLDLLVWPETALPFDLSANEAYYKRLQSLTRMLNAPLVLGTVEVPERGSYYNAIWMITPDGEPPQKYRKEKLVVFSEALPWYVGWVKHFGVAMGGFLVGQNNEVFRWKNREMVPLVCFEALFPDYVRKRTGHLMLNLTNDAWFGETAASSQHLQQIQLRSAETGMPLVRATNSGISCWVDTRGAVRDAGGLYVPETHVFEVPVPVEKPRVTSVFGVWSIRVVGIFILGWGILAAIRNRSGRDQAE